MSYLICRAAFVRHTHRSDQTREFAIGDIVDLKLDQAEIIQLCDDGYCLLAESQEQLDAIQFQLSH